MPALELLPPARVVRVRDTNTMLSILIKDDRLSPNRRMLAVLLHRYFTLGMRQGKVMPMTDQESREKEMLYNIIVAQYGNSRNVQWLDREDLPIPAERIANSNVEATDQIRAAMEAALGPKESNGAV